VPDVSLKIADTGCFAAIEFDEGILLLDGVDISRSVLQRRRLFVLGMHADGKDTIWLANLYPS